MATIDLTEASFDATLEKSAFTILAFLSDSSEPCNNFLPVFEAASATHSDILFGKVDADKEQEVTAAYGVRSVPTIVVMRDQIVLYSQPGSLSDENMEKLVAYARKLDMDKVRADVAAQESGEAPGATH